jgi:hypothetical protein
LHEAQQRASPTADGDRGSSGNHGECSENSVSSASRSSLCPNAYYALAETRAKPGIEG